MMLTYDTIAGYIMCSWGRSHNLKTNTHNHTPQSIDLLI